MIIKKIFFLAINLITVLSFSTLTFAQTTGNCDSIYTILEGDTIYSKVESEPDFTSGFENILRHFSENLDLSKISSVLSGKVELRIIINSDGKVVEALPNSNCELNLSEFEEFRRVALMMPNWKPAMCNGRTVSSTLILPIYYYPK